MMNVVRKQSVLADLDAASQLPQLLYANTSASLVVLGAMA